MAAFAMAFVSVGFVPAASAEDGSGTGEGTSDCNGIVDVTCDYDDDACVLYVEHNSPDISRCIVGG